MVREKLTPLQHVPFRMPARCTVSAVDATWIILAALRSLRHDLWVTTVPAGTVQAASVAAYVLETTSSRTVSGNTLICARAGKISRNKANA